MQRSEGKGLGSSFDHGFLRKGKASGLRTGSSEQGQGPLGCRRPLELPGARPGAMHPLLDRQAVRMRAWGLR